MTETVDQTARDAVNAAKERLAVTEATLQGRLSGIDSQIKNLSESITETKSFLKWFGGLLVTCMLSVLAWSLVQQINANDAQKQDMQKQLMLVQAQERNRQLQASAAQPTQTTSGP